MNRKCRLFTVFWIVTLLALTACQAPATSFPTIMSLPTITPLPTKTQPRIPTLSQTPTTTPLPTRTRPPISTPSLTPTPTPLCGTLTSVSAYSTSEPGKTFAKFEPPDGQVYFGFTFKLWDESPASENAKWGDVRPFAERICDSVKYELSGKTPTFIKVVSEWTNPFSASFADIANIHAALGPTVVPMIAWHTTPGITTKDIASGEFDGYIAQYARDVKAYGLPLFIVPICSEFNGSWWQLCSPKANSNLTRQDFVDAWHRVVDIFRQEGVTNVAWLWIPVAFPPIPQEMGRDPYWQAYYPGDEYVDWVGGNINDWGVPSWLDPLVQFGIDHKKPFFLAEFAIRHEGTKYTHIQRINWLNAMFNYFASHPQIKAIGYYNYQNNPDPNPSGSDHVFLYDGQVSYVPDVSDHDQRLIAGGNDIRALYASRIADPRYVSTLIIQP